MEGAGQWAAYRFARSRAGDDGRGESTVALLRDSRRTWSEDEGLALFLLLDAAVPSWQEQIFAATPGSPVDLLEAEIRR